MTADACTLHIRIRQTVTGPMLLSEKVYRLDELGLCWHVQPKTICNWLSLLRKSRLAPSPEQVRRVRGLGKTGRPTPFRRPVEIRNDYARLIAQVFREKNIRL